MISSAAYSLVLLTGMATLPLSVGLAVTFCKDFTSFVPKKILLLGIKGAAGLFKLPYLTNATLTLFVLG